MNPPEIGLHVCILQDRRVNHHWSPRPPRTAILKGNILKALLLKGMCVSEPPLTVPPPLWARMLPRSPAPSSARSSRSSMGTRASSAWTGLATITHPRLKGLGSAAAVSSRTPGLPSYETSRKARGGRMPQDLGPRKAFRGSISPAITAYPQHGFLKKCSFS